MRYMNDYEIEDRARQYRAHPVLGPATQTLVNLRDAANANSDGWCYWPEPVRAAARLMELIERDGTSRYRSDDERADATRDELKRALAPVKSFRTRSGLAFEIVDDASQWNLDPVDRAALDSGHDVKVSDGVLRKVGGRLVKVTS